MFSSIHLLKINNAANLSFFKAIIIFYNLINIVISTAATLLFIYIIFKLDKLLFIFRCDYSSRDNSYSDIDNLSYFYCYNYFLSYSILIIKGNSYKRRLFNPKIS